MTTKPKARKFRIRRGGPLGYGRPRAANDDAGQVAAAGVAGSYRAASGGDGPAPAMAGQAGADGSLAVAEAPQAAPGIDREIAEIRREGLTGRQLRMARRQAQKHGLAPTSDFDAVRLLRQAGIDPFQRTNMLELVVADGQAQKRQLAQTSEQPKLPQTVPHVPDNLPSTDLAHTDLAATHVMRVQRDIARRRRRKLMLMLARIAVFVLLPTFAAGYYYFAIATPMYATKSQFVIQQAKSQGPAGLGSMFAGTGLAVQQDSIAVQAYLQSRDAMMRLDADLGFKAHFSQPWIDPIQRLPADASMEDAYAVYQDKVKVGFDPTEGILKMEVIAADPQTSAAFSEALISYAEERVDSLTQRLREDQMAGARESYEDAENKVEAAQNRVLQLQERLGVLDPASETSALMSQITRFEIELREKRLQLAQYQDNQSPNSARVEGVKGDIDRLEKLVADLRASMTETTSGEDSLARITAELRIAEQDLANRQLLLQQAMTQLETARIEANRQVRYLSMGVHPVAPDDPTYPRAFENTLLAFLIFSGIYLMISMTAAILREQVSA